jgi:hypothetical protein
MNEKKDFKYEAQEPVVVSKKSNPEDESKEIEVKDVIFLTPARIEYTKEDGSTDSMTTGVDIIGRKVYVDNGVWTHSDAVFEYLDRINTLPEDFFEAGEDIYDKANKAVDEMEDIRKSTVEGVE